MVAMFFGLFLLLWLSGALLFALFVHYLVLRDEKRLLLRSARAYAGLVLWSAVWPVMFWRLRYAVWPLRGTGMHLAWLLKQSKRRS